MNELYMISSPETVDQRFPPDRSLVTITALTAGGNASQLPYHLNFGKENGLTEAAIVEAITHLAFYVGWPKAMTAFTVAKDVFSK
ncbi:carboxymuconolactone decarboxylase family protein [Glutamicibacter nicotianae]|nr:carboxymuconolactone decarboxylase family protein [Glutamicibacter nicotianae]